MSVNPAEQLLESRLMSEIRRLRNDLDQFKNRQRLGAASLIALYGSTGATGGFAIPAGTKTNVIVSAQMVNEHVIDMSIALFVGTDNNAAFLANYGSGLSAGQNKVDFAVNLNDSIPFNPIDNAYPATQYWQVGIRNGDTVAHTVYLYATALFPVGTR